MLLTMTASLQGAADPTRHRRRVPKTILRAGTRGCPTAEALAALRKGSRLKDGPTRTAEVEGGGRAPDGSGRADPAGAVSQVRAQASGLPPDHTEGAQPQVRRNVARMSACRECCGWCAWSVGGAHTLERDRAGAKVEGADSRLRGVTTAWS